MTDFTPKMMEMFITALEDGAMGEIKREDLISENFIGFLVFV